MAITFIRDVITSGYNLSKINSNFEKIQTALQDAVSRTGTGPNQLSADLDMNSNDLINVGNIDADEIKVGGVDLSVRLQDVIDVRDETEAFRDEAEDFAIGAGISESNAQASASSSSSSATAANTSRISAEFSAAQAAFNALASGTAIYESEPIGRAASVNGQLFRVQVVPGSQLWRRDNAGSSTFLGWIGEVIFDNVSTLLASSFTGFTTGQIIRTRQEGFSYTVAASGASDNDVVTAGGVKLYMTVDVSGFLNGRQNENNLALLGYPATTQVRLVGTIPVTSALTVKPRNVDGSNAILRQSNGANLSTVATIDVDAVLGAIASGNINLAVDGNSANNTNGTAIHLKTLQLPRGEASLLAQNANRGILVSGDVEKCPLYLFARGCSDVGVEFSPGTGVSPDEIVAFVFTTQSGTGFRASGAEKMSGVVTFGCEGLSAYGADIGVGWWNLQGEVREVGTAGPGSNAVGLRVTGSEARITGELHVYAADEGGLLYAADIQAGRVDGLKVHCGSSVSNVQVSGARILGGVSGSMMLSMRNSSTGDGLILGSAAAALNGFHVLQGTSLSSAANALNLERATNCVIEISRIFGAVRISSTSSGNVISIPRNGALTTTFVNERTQLDNTVVLRGAYSLSNLSGISSAFRGMQAEWCTDFRGPAYYDGSRWVPSNGTILSGEVTMIAGQTTVNVAHGLGFVPNRNWISAIVTGDIGSGNRWWVGRDATNIIFRLASAAPTDVTFGYKLSRES